MEDLVTKSLKIAYVVFAFCSALTLGALKGLLVGPIAGLLLICGNVVVILGLLPAHVVWTVYALLKTTRFDSALKVALSIALLPLFGLWLGFSIAGSVLVGVGYGFFTPWVSTFEAFREDRESKKFKHCIVDGTWQTIKGSCTVVRDFTDFCYFSYPQLLKELREGSGSEETQTIRLIDVPAIAVVGLLGLVVEIPLYTVIAVLKSPYMLFKGWQRLLHDLVSREGPFLETACVPIAGLAIIFWPLVVIGSILLAVLASFFVGLYGSVIVYQERSFRKGVAYIIAMVSEFDEYTNDWLYLREGSVLPNQASLSKKKASHSSELSVGGGSVGRVKVSEAPAMLVPSLAPSRSVRETIQEVKVVQIWEDIMKSCEMRGKELIDAKVITVTDLNEWLKAKTPSQGSVVGVGVPCYALFVCLVNSIKAGSPGLVLTDGVHVTPENLPQDRLLEWFFQPFLVIKEQIKVIRLSEGELKFLSKLIVLGGSPDRMEAWDNGSEVPQEAMKLGQIQAISRRLNGMTKSISKFPTYRRRFRHVVKSLIAYCPEKEGSMTSHSSRSVASLEVV